MNKSRIVKSKSRTGGADGVEDRSRFAVANLKWEVRLEPQDPPGYMPSEARA